MRPAVLTCRRPGCGMPIVIALTAADGRRQVLDAAPDPDGNVYAYPDTRGNLHARSKSAGAADKKTYEAIYMPHNATCKTPKHARRRARTARPRSPDPVSQEPRMSLTPPPGPVPASPAPAGDPHQLLEEATTLARHWVATGGPALRGAGRALLNVFGLKH